MRPIKLTLQAFGPFAGKVVLDFRAALDQRLFGIYGPTGSGKTSILDGICFALFGQSSGEERQAPQLRSDHAADDVPTEVTLIFEVGAKRYYIRRSPAQSVAGRGGHLTTRQHTADIFDVSGVPVDEVRPDFCGIPLAERKTGEVEAKVRELLGYSADQFRQVVLLPQGKFRKLLTASSKERSEVLHGLFDVRIYGRFAAKLKLEADQLKEQVTTTEAVIRESLANQSLASRDDLEATIATCEQQMVELGQARDKADAALSTANSAFEEGKQRGERFAQLTAAREGLAQLDDQSAEINAMRAKATLALQAKSVQPVFDEAARAATARTEAAIELNTHIESEARAIEALETAQSALAASLAAEPERVNLVTHRQDLDVIVKRLNAASPLTEALTVAKAAEDEAVRIEAAKLKDIETAKEAHALARLAYDHATGRSGEIIKLKSQLRDLELEKKAAEAYGASSVRLDELRAAAAKAATLHAGVKTAADVARAAHAEAERILAEAQAAHLAAKLEDGAPCPVCGSERHPDPATGDVLTAGRDNAFRQTQEALVACDTAERRAHDGWVSANAQLESHSENHGLLAAPMRSAAEINTDFDQTSGSLDELERLPSQEAQLIALTAAEAKLKTATDALQIASQAVASARTVTAAASASLQNELSTVPDKLRFPGAALRALQDAQAAESRAVKAHTAAMESEQSARTKVVLEANNVANARQRLVFAEAANTAAQDRLSKSLIGSNLNLEQFQSARGDIDDIESLQQTVQAYDTSYQLARGRLQSAEEAIVGIEPPDMDALVLAKSAAAEAHKSAVEAIATATSQVTTLSNLLKSITAKEAQIVVKRQRYEIVGELSDLSSGKNEKKLRLQDFAIMATFEDVLEAANLRFERMSRGRYSLIRKEDLSRSGAVSGLEIQVFDAQTEKARDAGTVSGGEGFLASLALALGLSDVIQSESGGIKLDAIFIDEGFDQLDSDTLDLALNTLSDLVAADRAIGMISHVDAVKETIPAAFQLRHGLKGSVLDPQLGLEN